MFTELMPLLKQRHVVITISYVDEELLRVNVIPKKRHQEADEDQALAVPLSLTGSPDELDRELPGQLATFTESVIKTGSNLDELRAEHAAAIKAVEAENRKKLEEKKRLSGNRGTSAPPQRMPQPSSRTESWPSVASPRRRKPLRPLSSTHGRRRPNRKHPRQRQRSRRRRTVHGGYKSDHPQSFHSLRSV